MGEATELLLAVERGDPQAADQLLPLVYDQLRLLAARKLADEPPGQTLQPTALVHEAYIRLVGPLPTSPAGARGEAPARWNSRGHFYAAAAEAMRRILVEAARRKHSCKRGGGLVRRDIDEIGVAAPESPEEILALDEALARLASTDGQAAELVRVRFFAGLPLADAAELLGVSPRSADRLWAYARAWLHQELRGDTQAG
jgi:RNA polymerase sigma factor (TIGR02999 family)